MEHDSGECAIAPNVQLGYLEQTGTSGSTLTIYDEATSKMETLNRLKKTLFGGDGEDDEYALHRERGGGSGGASRVGKSRRR